MPRLRDGLDLLLAGFVGLTVIGAFLLMVLANRVGLVVQALRHPNAMLQGPQQLSHRAYQ